jgi:hypothetical protein
MAGHILAGTSRASKAKKGIPAMTDKSVEENAGTDLC